MRDQKTCSKCGESKPLDAEHFETKKSSSDGFTGQCRVCRNTQRRERYAELSTPPAAEPDAAQLGTARPWATELELEALDALTAAGSVAAAAESLSITPRRLRGLLSELERRAAARGWAPGSDMVKPQPEGFHVKGVSTLYGADGSVRGQWVKTRATQESRLQALMDAVQSLAEPFRGLADPVPVPDPFSGMEEDLLAVYPMGDPHLGMFAWARETGAPFDLEIAERNLYSAVDQLVMLAPRAKHALLIDLGDFFHTDNGSNQTMRSHHALDVDTRWPKILGVGVRLMRRAIDRALEKHEHVTVIIEIGNHDDYSSIMLALCLQNYYEREPRVTIDTSPSKFHWYRFGKCLLGVTHGDTVKADKLPGIMACDRAIDWGETIHRKWYTGHVHHDSLKEYAGVTIETFRTLAARDAWHHGAGYRSERDMKCDIWHREFGMVQRHIVGIRQL